MSGIASIPLLKVNSYRIVKLKKYQVVLDTTTIYVNRFVMATLVLRAYYSVKQTDPQDKE